jgi:P27 family predicted phage terminase small subunit
MTAPILTAEPAGGIGPKKTSARGQLKDRCPARFSCRQQNAKEVYMGGIGSGGHNRKPVEFHKRAGTYRKDRHGVAIDWSKAPPAQVNPPRWFTPDAKKFWREHRNVCEEMGTLDQLTQTLFEVVCETWSDIQEFGEQIKTEGSVIDGRPHPLLSARNRAIKDFWKLAAEFGLTPRGRQRLNLPTEQPDNDEFGVFMEKRERRNGRDDPRDMLKGDN